MTPWTKQANGIFIWVILFQILLTCGIVMWTDSNLLIGIAGGLFISAGGLTAIFAAPSHSATPHIVAISTMLNTALHIHLGYGLTELHFELFALLAIVAMYQRWAVILSALLVALVHHVAFFLMQSSGTNTFIFENGHLTFGILAIHAFFAISEATILMLTAQSRLKSSERGLYLEKTIRNMTAKPGYIDLTVVEKSSCDNDFYQLVEQIKGLLHSVNGAVVDVTQQTSSLVGNMQTIERGLNENGMRLSTIAAATEETAATNQELSSQAASVGEASEHCRGETELVSERVDDSVERTKSLAMQMQTAKDTIDALSEMCLSIEKEMEIIKGIADQTNLLALNAAIESARAGEHGRGFAVVADEVRQLSIRSGENAEKINDVTRVLIEKSQNAVLTMNECLSGMETNCTESEALRENIRNIIEQIKRVDDGVSAVTQATEEQAHASQDISASTQEIHSSMDEQRHESEMALGATSKLTSASEALSQQIMRFTVNQ